MSTVIGIVIACLVILVLVTLIVLYAFKTEKWCFSRKYSSCSASVTPARAAPPGSGLFWTLTLSNTWLLYRLGPAWLVPLSHHCRIDAFVALVAAFSFFPVNHASLFIVFYSILILSKILCIYAYMYDMQSMKLIHLF